MRWPTHQVAALGCGLLFHLPFPALVASLVGAVFPDVLDQRIAGLALGKRGKQRLFNRIHRGTTHWFGLWLALLFFALARPVDLPFQLLAGVSLGALSHVALDMLTPQGVPVLPFSRRGRLAVPVCRTGGIGEYAFLALCVGLCVYLLRADIAGLLSKA